MSKLKVITLGDKTTTGGIVENGALTVYCHGKLVALIGSRVYCPQCKTTGVINKTRPFNVYAEGKLVCLENDVVECACPLGTNRVTASPDAFEFIGYENGSVGMSTASFAATQIRNIGDTHPATAEFQAQRFSSFDSKPEDYTKICRPEDNDLLNGVFIWTETTSAGHAFISVHENNSIYVFTYGRFGRQGFATITGDGILNFLIGDDARLYYREELYGANARVFRITEQPMQEIRKVLESWWNAGTHPVITKDMGERTRRRGRVIDVYDLTGSNCTTHTVKAMKAAGSDIFDVSYTSTTTQMPISKDDDFTVPVSLQNHLATLSADISSMKVIEVTDLFRKEYPNIEDFKPGAQSILHKGEEAAAGSASTVGSSTGISGGAVGGSFGGSYEVN